MIRLSLPLPPGYDPGPVLAYHARDSRSRNERVEGNVLLKAVVLGGRPAVVRIAVTPGSAAVEADLAEDQQAAVQRLAGRLLALGWDVGGFLDGAARHPVLAPLVARRPQLRPGQGASVFEALAWAVIGQQINLAFAAELRRSLIELAGTPHPSGMIAHPTPEQVALIDPESLRARRYSRQKIDYLIGAAQAIASGALPVEELPGSSPEAAYEALRGLRGIGPWTARYVLLRGCAFPDMAPIGDAGLAAALQRACALPSRPTPDEQAALMAPFTPHRSLATAHLWASLADQ